MAFCENCGTEIPQGKNFCPNCGTAVKAQPASEEVNAAPQEAQQTGEQNSPEGQPEEVQGTQESQPVNSQPPIQPQPISNEQPNGGGYQQNIPPQQYAPQEGPDPAKPFFVACFVLGIVSLLFALILHGAASILPIILGVVGIILYITGKKRGPKTGLATAGFVTSIIGVVIAAISFVACVACAGCVGCGSRMVGRAVGDAIGDASRSIIEEYEEDWNDAQEEYETEFEDALEEYGEDLDGLVNELENAFH